MKKTITGLLSVLLSTVLFAQQKDFEGLIVYKVDVKSKKEGVSDKTMKIVLGMADNSTVFIKQGNYRHSSDIRDTYFISKKQKAYYKFKGIDTLFYLDYFSDTGTVLNVSKLDEQRVIAGLACKAIIIQTGTSTSKYYYSPELHMNPEYDRNHKIGQHNVYTKETESLWLALFQEAESYSLSETCTRFEWKSIEDNVFDLPKLPEREFTVESVTKAPEFARAGGWKKYLETNLNAQLGAKYIKIPRGESEAVQTVQVGFVISERGEVLNVKVLNKGEVHSKLAEEAMRVVSESRGWKPATMYGEKINFYLKQPVTFNVSKQ